MKEGARKEQRECLLFVKTNGRVVCFVNEQEDTLNIHSRCFHGLHPLHDFLPDATLSALSLHAKVPQVQKLQVFRVSLELLRRQRVPIISEQHFVVGTYHREKKLDEGGEGKEEKEEEK